MTIINDTELKLSIDKLKMYYNEELHQEELFKNLFTKKIFYESSNINKLKEYENFLYHNIKKIGQNHLKNIEYIENYLNNYNITALKNAKLFENMVNNYDE